MRRGRRPCTVLSRLRIYTQTILSRTTGNWKWNTQEDKRNTKRHARATHTHTVESRRGNNRREEDKRTQGHDAHAHTRTHALTIEPGRPFAADDTGVMRVGLILLGLPFPRELLSDSPPFPPPPLGPRRGVLCSPRLCRFWPGVLWFELLEVRDSDGGALLPLSRNGVLWFPSPSVGVAAAEDPGGLCVYCPCAGKGGVWKGREPERVAVNGPPPLPSCPRFCPTGVALGWGSASAWRSRC